MRIASRDLRVVSVGLVSAVLLVGCSGNSSKPTVIPALTLSTTPTVATTPAPAPSTTPAAATSATSPSAGPTTAATTSLPTATSAAPPTPASTAEKGDPTVAAEMISVVKSYYATANAATHNITLLPKWRDAFVDSCRTCKTDYSIIKKELGLGTKYIGGGYQIRSLSPTSWDSKGGRLGLTFVTVAGKAYDKSGKLIDSLETSKLRRATITVQQQKQHWYVVFFEEAAS